MIRNFARLPTVRPAIHRLTLARVGRASAARATTRRFAATASAAPTHFRALEKLENVDPAKRTGDEDVYDHPLAHPVWTEAELALGDVQEHKTPQTLIEKAAFASIQVIRVGFDVVSGFAFGRLTEAKLLRRILFLETVAGVPGFVGAALRHLRSLRRIQRDRGWIQSLLAEAENERMHMLLFSEIKKPTLLFRGMVLVTQGIFWNLFFVAYLLSPTFCHSFVGYLEESAVYTYTKAIEACDNELREWGHTKATPLARKYYQLPESATMKDVLRCVRLDEAWHRSSNHTLSELNWSEDANPMREEHLEFQQKMREKLAEANEKK